MSACLCWRVSQLPGGGGGQDVQRAFHQPLDLNGRRKVIVLHASRQTSCSARRIPTRWENLSTWAAWRTRWWAPTTTGQPGTEHGLHPLLDLADHIQQGNKLNSIIFTTRGLTSEESNEAFEQDYRRVIAANHRFAPEDEGAIWLWNRFTSYLQAQNAMGILRIAIWVIGIFTLLSGIVGVSNIMLITVRERTHEFGIRKALGAKPRSILWLIIVESVTITTVFGYVGMVAGIGATEWMNVAFGSQTVDAGLFEAQMFSDPTVDIGIAVQATLTLIVAGTLAGLFPARKATKIRPIEALRAE